MTTISNRLLRIVEFFVPTPDLAIYLDRDAEEIYAQKPELTVNEIKREQKVIKELLGRRANGRVIDARHGVDDTVDRVTSEILETLLQKTHK